MKKHEMSINHVFFALLRYMRCSGHSPFARSKDPSRWSNDQMASVCKHQLPETIFAGKLYHVTK
jgi:hypothetical protein